MLKDDDAELDQLLARGLSSGAQYDQIERRVLEQVAPRRARWLWPTLVPVGAVASALAAWFLLIGTGSQQPARSIDDELGLETAGRAPDPFRPKGGGTPASTPNAGVHGGMAAGALDIGCGGSTPGVCRLGETLMFSLSDNATSGYLAAYAERVGDPSTERIWYFPSADGSAPRIDAKSGTAVASQGVHLGPPHAPGLYRVTVWVSEAPSVRALAEQPGASARTTLKLEIVP